MIKDDYPCPVCSSIESDYQKISGIHYDTPAGEKSLTIKVTFCVTCGELLGVEEW